MQGIEDDDGNPAHWLPLNKDRKRDVVTERRKEKRDVVRLEGEKGGEEYRSLTWPPDYYVAHKHITPKQYLAARRFYALWAGSKHQHHYVQVAYEERGGSVTPIYLHGVKVESRFLINLEYLRALRAVNGLIRQKVLVKVVCNEKKAGSQMVVLKEALDCLVTHFRY